MRKFLFIVLTITLHLTSLLAEPILKGPIVMGSASDQWVDSFEPIKDPDHSECRMIEGHKNIMFCLHKDSVKMHSYIGRASAYIEGVGPEDTEDGVAIKKGDLIKVDDPRTEIFRQAMVGFDLKAKDLKGFYKAVEIKCKQDTSFCLSADEKFFYEKVIAPQMQKDSEFVLLTTSSHIGPQPTKHIMRHEYLHGLYFTNSDFRNTVDNYWENKVSERDHKSIIKNLSDTYDPTDMYLIRNEFQSYLLEVYPGRARFGLYLSRHRNRLIADLKEAGQLPDFVEAKPFFRPGKHKPRGHGGVRW